MRRGRIGRRMCVASRKTGPQPRSGSHKTTGKVAQQVEGLGQNVIARDRLEFGNVQRRQNLSELEHSWTASFTALAWRRDDRITGIEQNRAAVFHISIDALKLCIGGPPCA